MDLRETYQNKKVFVTGHTGFKGSWLITWLHSLGAAVKGYSLPVDDKDSLFSAIRGEELCESVEGDVRDRIRLRNEILSFEPDFIFHLAAQPLVRLSYEIPLETIEINSQGTANVLDALRFLSKPCVAVMITTDKVYHNREEEYAYTENDKLGGHDPYSASKASAEIVIETYRKSFFNPETYIEHRKTVSTARAGNVIGGGDWAKDRIIPDIIRALVSGQAVEVRNPSSIRPWQHVLEPLQGYLVLGAHQKREPNKYAESFNLGPYPDDVLQVHQLVEKAIDCWGSGSYFTPLKPHKLHEANLLQLDISKALSVLDWRPQMSAYQAIVMTVEWYKGYLRDNVDARTLIQMQIEEFVKKG